MEVKVSAESMATDKKVVQSLDDFKKLSSDQCNAALNSICAFVLGMKIGAQLNAKGDKATAATA